MFTDIGLIGCGNMGGTIAKLIARNAPEARFHLANRGPEKAAELAGALPNASVTGNAGVAANAKLLLLGVKPQVMPAVLREIAPVLAERKDRFVLVTMAAGLTCQTIAELAGGTYPVIRIMPNTPVAVGAGVIQYCALGATAEECETFRKLLDGSGTADAIDEKLIDAASALSGCGPAFCCLFLEALADGAVACGLPRQTALLYAAQTLEGTAKLARLSGKHPGAMKDAVCSPGGTTIAGVRTLEEKGLRAAAMDAVIAAYEKTLQLK
ncbi:MAG: pyrroline-5-carboxylate reductase [Clostridia bacterium]|nr:pyrroline-5-carboxylate reductase [Clostridia bacterium]